MLLQLALPAMSLAFSPVLRAPIRCAAGRAPIRCAAAASAAHVDELAALATKYDAFLLDQFGVIHDGKTAYDGAVEAVTALQRMGKKQAHTWCTPTPCTFP